MKSILISIKSVWAAKIFDGTKTVEFRKRFAKTPSYPIRALVYASSPTKAILGQVNISNTVTETPAKLWERFGPYAACEVEDYQDYLSQSSYASVLILESPIRFEKNIDLAIIRSEYGTSPPQTWRWIIDSEPLARLFYSKKSTVR